MAANQEKEDPPRSDRPYGRRTRPPQIDGMLNVDKPEGITSMDVLRRIKRASGQRRVGHGGTLDPFATGVIPVCFGQATRMMEYLIDGTRVYRAVIELGVETDTYDSQGAVTSRADASGITRQDLEAALASFMGVIEQVPPMYRALKREGKRLYELARASARPRAGQWVQSLSQHKRRISRTRRPAGDSLFGLATNLDTSRSVHPTYS